MSKGFKQSTTVTIIHEVKPGQWKELRDTLITLAIDASQGGVRNTKEKKKNF